MNIYEKLLEIQSKLKVPKFNYNSFGKYKYRSCENILEAIKPICQENKVVVQITDEIQNIGQRYYVMATATLIDIETGEQICTKAYAREEDTKKGMDASQITGASSSYARKYALGGLFGIDDTKDSDTTNTGENYIQNKSNINAEKNPKKESVKQVCECCNKEIEPHGNYSVDELIKNSLANYEKKLCFDCCKKYKKMLKEQKNPEVENTNE